MVARGTHPNSLANLRPFGPGEQPVHHSRGPIITPAMRKYSAWTFTELVELAASPKANKLPMSDVIAITTLLKAAKEVAWGDKAREMVISRLDGEPDKSVEVNVGVQVIVREVHGSGQRELG